MNINFWDMLRKTNQPIYNGNLDIKFILTISAIAGMGWAVIKTVPDIQREVVAQGKDIVELKTDFKNLPNTIIAELAKQGILPRRRI